MTLPMLDSVNAPTEMEAAVAKGSAQSNFPPTESQ